MESIDSAFMCSNTVNEPSSFPPVDENTRRVLQVSSCMMRLPPEIRSEIYEYAFSGNRVEVTSSNGCYCSSTTRGPHFTEHRWLLRIASGQVRQDAQLAFIRNALWQLHCSAAVDCFVEKMLIIGGLPQVRHIRINVFETSKEPWELPVAHFPGLQDITFGPWQNGWTIDVPATEGSDQLTDYRLMEKLDHILREKVGYGTIRDAVQRREDRGFKMYFVFPIKYLLPRKSLPHPRWQLKVSHI
jgi:hypothetical protein